MCYNKNMKKKNLLFFAIIFAIISVFALAFGVNNLSHKSVVFAESEDEATTITEDDGAMDPTLFSRLVNFYNNNLPAEKTKVKDLTTDMFADDHFLGMTLDLSGTDEEKIITLANFDLFDLSKFEKIDLSKNAIYSLSSIFKNTNFSSINLSDNYLQSFDCLDVNYLKLTNLDLSFNLITKCDLKEILTVVKEDPNEQVDTVVNLQDNFLDTENLILPDDENVVLNLSHNLIEKSKLLEKIEKDTLPATYKLGFQGLKRSAYYKVSDSVRLEFYGFDDVTEITLQKADTSSLSTNEVMKNIDSYKPTEYQDVKTIFAGEQMVFDTPGYYNLVFTNDDAQKTGLKVDLYFYVRPNAPKVEMYKNGEKIDFANKVNQNVDIKVLDAQDNVTYIFKNSITGEITVGDTLQITNPGRNYFAVYQIIDGCLSDKTVISVNYEKSIAFGWTYILIGIAVFGVVGFVVYKSIPKIASLGLGKKGRNKKNLD